MTKFQMTRTNAPWDYPTLGFVANTNGAILDGSLSTPPITIPPDPFWDVYVGGSAETGITRYGNPIVTPVPETTKGYVLTYSTTANSFVPTAPAWARLDTWTGVPETSDDSTNLQAAFAAAVAGGFPLVATAGKTYRGKNLDPTGTTVDWTGATLRHPDGGTVANMLVPTGAFRTIGGTFDGNKANTTDSGDDQVGNPVYCYNTLGWSGQVRMEGGPVFVNSWRFGARFQTVPELILENSLLDAEDAPAASVFLDHPEAHDNVASGILCYGLDGLTITAPYVHNNTKNGLTIALCKAPRTTGVRALSNNIHGWVSQYCVDDYVDGVSNGNGKGGFTWGGGSTSIAPGRRHRFGDLVANGNGTVTIPFGGVTFDPTVSGDPNFKQLDAKGDSIIANDNSGAGFQLTFGIGVDVGSITCDSNDTHGISLSGAKFSYGVARCRNNGTTASHHGIAEFGSTTDYGNHFHGRYELTGNGDTLTDPFTANPGSITASTYTMRQAGSPTPSGSRLRLAADHAGVTSSTALVDTALVAALNTAGTTYPFRALVKYEAGTTGDIRIGISVPTGAVASWVTFGPTTTAAGTPATATTSGDLTATQVALHGGIGAGSTLDVLIEGEVTLDATHTGSLTIRYAQSVSDVTATIVKAKSYLSLG